MKRIFTLCLGVLFASGAFAQLERPTAVIKKATVKPVIDGVFDDVWATTDSFAINRPFTGEAPTLGEPGETYWKALWDEDGYYLIVNVADDAYFPNYLHAGGGDAWVYDKPEIYFDVNYVLEDALGPNVGGSGHHQMAPDMTAAKENGMLNTETNTRQHAFKVDAPSYVAEYFVPWASLIDKDGVKVNIEEAIGFDVSINDNDPDNNTRRRAVWGNDNSSGTGESWTNMDECGIITFEGAEVTFMTEINISVDGGITEDNQQLQINVEYLPEDATETSVIWKVSKADGTKVRASISPSGLITPVVNEELIIYATDSFIDSNPITVSISGQVVTEAEINMIKNGNFELGTDGKQNWGGPGIVTDGWYNVECTPTANIWDKMFGQAITVADASTPYTIKFKAVASVDMAIPMLVEDRSNGNDKVVTSLSEYRDNGYGKWDVPITTEAKWFTIDMIFSNFKENSKYELNFQLGQNDGILSIDSIQMFKDADLALIPTAISQQRAMESFRVYPNPASSYLNVELSTINSRVAIYNSVGVKIDEAVVSGNRHSFDVSRYAKGLYFVKANGAVIKFIK